MNLGLTPEQLARHKLGISGSRAGRVMSGDRRSLWREIKGLQEPEDLSNNLAVQMGSATEGFNAFWFEKQTGRRVSRRGEFVQSVSHPFMIAHLDGVTGVKAGWAYWDAKHVGKVDEGTILRYTPQMTHCCTILGLDWWVLSVFVGNSKWEMIEQEIDPMYQAQLIALEREFWQFVVDDVEPPEAKMPVLAPKPQPKLRSIVIPTDNEDVFEALCRKDNWLHEACSEHIRAIVGTDAAAKVNAIHKAAMKDLVPEDVGEIKYGRYKLSRTKAGAVTQTVAKLEE